MARPRLFLLGAALFLIVVASAAQAHEIGGWRADVTLSVRTYDSFGVPDDDLSTAQDEAAVTFREAGVEITWVNCYPGGRNLLASSPRCAEPLDSSELMLRIVSETGDEPNRRVTMGFSWVSRQQAMAPHVATVFADRVQRVAHAARANVVGVLALAIAHELGHVLLASTAHAKVGLMQAVWSHSQLRRSGAELRFLDEEALAMRTILRRRSR
jgi:hypothetical protein